MWKHTWSPSPAKARLSKSVGKVMSIIFCDTKGIVLNHMAHDNTIVNGDYYSGELREQLRRAIRDKRPELYSSGLILHQDNAPVHVSCVVKQTMSDLNIEPLQHPQYSPDLAICDFFLFPTVKDHLRGRKFESREEQGTAITEALRMVTRDGLQHVFRTWVERWDKCIKAKGSYFEKEWNLFVSTSNSIYIIKKILEFIDHHSYIKIVLARKLHTLFLFIVYQ